MRVKKIGTWSFNLGGPHGDEGIYIEAVDAPDQYRYAKISYGFLDEETQTAPLLRGEVVEVALITPDELANRLPDGKP